MKIVQRQCLEAPQYYQSVSHCVNISFGEWPGRLDELKIEAASKRDVTAVYR